VAAAEAARLAGGMDALREAAAAAEAKTAEIESVEWGGGRGGSPRVRTRPDGPAPPLYSRTRSAAEAEWAAGIVASALPPEGEEA
jgi:hypothetical protein